jgi:hypothetical protein
LNVIIPKPLLTFAEAVKYSLAYVFPGTSLEFPAFPSIIYIGALGLMYSFKDLLSTVPLGAIGYCL